MGSRLLILGLWIGASTALSGDLPWHSKEESVAEADELKDANNASMGAVAERLDDRRALCTSDEGHFYYEGIYGERCRRTGILRGWKCFSYAVAHCVDPSIENNLIWWKRVEGYGQGTSRQYAEFDARNDAAKRLSVEKQRCQEEDAGEYDQSAILTHGCYEAGSFWRCEASARAVCNK